MSGTDLERLNIILAARDREFTKALDRNVRRIERFSRKSQKQLSHVSRKFDAMGFAIAGWLCVKGYCCCEGKILSEPVRHSV